ncbi:MAG: deoxyribodipyrimidine photo-lyase [Acetobacterium sp.]
MFEDRIKIHFERPINFPPEGYCLYWMQQSQRISYNHALSYAIELSNAYQLPLLVYFGLTDNFPEANERHYAFMLEGLLEVSKSLEQLNIGFHMVKASPEIGIEPYLKEAAFLVMDKGYLKIQRKWRDIVVEKALATSISGVYELESDLIVPIEITSSKEEYAARTIRPKIHKHLDRYAINFFIKSIDKPWSDNDFKISQKDFKINNNHIINPTEINEFLQRATIDHTVKKSPFFKGGYVEARRRLQVFIANGLPHYSQGNSPAFVYQSGMSPYLHFGQISSLEIYLILQKLDNIPIDSYLGFLEQLIVRRELAFNYIYYRDGYDVFTTMTNPWAYHTMGLHDNDNRPTLYDLETLENYVTHDIYWNSAMKEMVITGYMHNYMRMYWCKKIIEWTPNYKKAYETAIYLNNKYFIDGRDVNSYTGVAWCFGLHDRGWREREVFGTLRYMNAQGLKRKFDMQKYIDRINKLSE